nr:hypothetical protein [Deltaproteobacteria bacterium]
MNALAGRCATCRGPMLGFSRALLGLLFALASPAPRRLARHRRPPP